MFDAWQKLVGMDPHWGWERDWSSAMFEGLLWGKAARSCGQGIYTRLYAMRHSTEHFISRSLDRYLPMILNRSLLMTWGASRKLHTVTGIWVWRPSHTCRVAAAAHGWQGTCVHARARARASWRGLKASSSLYILSRRCQYCRLHISLSFTSSTSSILIKLSFL